jgi:AraC-like DNA-binding protein
MCPVEATDETEMMRLIDEYLERCYRTRSVPRASEFAACLKRCPSTVSKRVLRVCGVPLGMLLRQKRLAKAALLLRTTDLTLDAIIAQTAPGDRRSFFRAFRAVFHKTPLEYRVSQERCSENAVSGDARKCP